MEAQTNELRLKNEALDQFTATVSHDLKAPLRHLSMFAEMISEDLHRGEVTELVHYADHVRKSAARMRRIIDSLLEFSQIAYRITAPPLSCTWPSSNTSASRTTPESATGFGAVMR